MIIGHCKICSDPIPDRPYQKQSARCCSPGCARRLAYNENPNIGGFHKDAKMDSLDQRAEELEHPNLEHEDLN